ncbi:MAG: radical SAM family heme chaperone HemW [Candidatus Dormibacteria bacterium]
MATEAPRALYLHVPFCSRRCPYCDFAIRVGGDRLQEAYVQALGRELARLGEASGVATSLQSLYLGGGTPSLLRLDLLERLLGEVARHFRLAAAAEVTLEANPADVNRARARQWRSLGVNRLSLGVQSLDDRVLGWLGRNHDAAAAHRAITAARRAGFDNLSCDLIYAVPVQPTAVFVRGLETLLRHRPEHVSCYELTVEAGTPLARRIAARRAPAPSEDDFLEQHRLARQRLLAAGLEHYEVSNYALPGHRSRHHLAYWRGEHYLAAGAGAHGFLGPELGARLGMEPAPSAGGVRYWNRRSTDAYLRQVSRLGHGRAGWESVGPGQLELERLSCGLRLREGVSLGAPARSGRARELAELGLLELEGDRVRATPRGVEVLDRLSLELASA